jgi:CheY-like chemotaxis protein
MADILGEFGYNVDVAYDGESALKLVRKNSYAAALLDLKMPGMDGLTLYRKIKEVSSDTAAVIITAYTSKTIASEALQAEVVQVFPKPVDLPRLMTELTRILDRPSVLVVDDDGELCLNLRDLLNENGYRACSAPDVPEAETLLESLRFDVVLIDMKLPHGDGYSVFRKLQQVGSKARVIAITGYRAETEPLVKKVVSEGADAVCYKPFNVSDLLATLSRLTCHGKSSV